MFYSYMEQLIATTNNGDSVKEKKLFMFSTKKDRAAFCGLNKAARMISSREARGYKSKMGRVYLCSDVAADCVFHVAFLP